MIDNQDIQSNQVNHGGARVGAGRKRMNVDARWLAARGDVTPLHASVILAQVCNERQAWHRVLNSEDDRVVLSALTFLVAMRDGKPAQQINVTSLGVTVTVDEIEKARAIVREITGQREHIQECAHTDVRTLEQAAEPTPDVRSESLAKPLMLSGDGGGGKGGE